MKKRLLSIDIETYSSVDLGECGVYPYVEAPDFQILLFAYAFDDEPVQCIDLYHHPLPERLRVALMDPNIIKCAFNANFERTCLGKYLETRMLPEQWRCTMVKALTLGLPGSLEKVALAMGLPEDKQKDKEGKALIRYFSIPCKPTKANGGRTRNLPEHDPVKWDKFIRYCIQDVEVEHGIREKLSTHRTLKIEHEYWCLDQDINDRGINLDMPLIEEAIHTDAEIKESAFAEIQRLTGVENPNSRAQIKEWVEKQLDRELEKFDKEILADLVKELPDGSVKRVIYLRQLTTKTSVKKYEKMKMYKCSDGRARGTMQFYGASRTGRFCLTGDHEVLTESGWIRLDEWKGGKIACWNINSQALSFQKSEPLSFDYDGALCHIDSKRIDQLSTPEHKMPFNKGYGEPQIATVEELENMGSFNIYFTGYRRLNYQKDNTHLRILIMTQADGCYCENGGLSYHFRKIRKIQRCKMLLRRGGVPFSEHKNKDGSTTIRIFERHLPLYLRMFKDKTFGTWLWDENPAVVFEELEKWDGYRSAKNSLQYSSTNKKNADIIQAFAHLVGYSGLMAEKQPGNRQTNVSYIVNIWFNPTSHTVSKKITRESFSGKVYCATTPTGFFLVRRNGRVWVTGNSGRGVQLQNLAKNHMDDLGDARYLVRSSDVDLLSLCYDNIPDVLSQLVRTALIPSEGCRFIVSDFSSIEARVIAWLAGEQWRLKVFEDGGDIYCASASQMFGVPVEKNGINGELRQKGKVAELACIAEGTLISTDQGLVPIEYVTTDMKLWDGVEYVSHKGVIYKGKKEVITYEGLTATPNHLVWVEGERGPIHFGEAARSGKHIYKPRSSGADIRKCKNNKPGKALQTRLESMLCTNKVQTLWKNTLDKFIQSYKRNFKGMSTLFTTTSRPKMAIQKTDSCKTTMRKPKRPRISKLRRSGHKILFPQCQRCLQMDYGEFGLQQRTRAGSYRQQRKLRARKPPVCNQKTESGESKDNHFAGMESRRVAICPQHSEPLTCERDESIRDTRFRTSGSDQEEKKLERNSKEARVYDIVMCGPRNRYVANGCLVHNCGYGGGVGSLKAFGADKMGLSEDEMQKIITDWRLASPRITKLWWDVDRAAKKAISDGKVINLQYGLRFACFDNRLFIQLPSKRSLAYMNPRILPNRRFGKDGIVYDGIQQQSHKWGQIDTYGPKLVENIVQAIARDCLLIAMKRLDDAGFKTVSHVHDEVILDVPKGTGSDEEVGEIMGQPIDWAPGLLLRADGYECDYYMKD